MKEQAQGAAGRAKGPARGTGVLPTRGWCLAETDTSGGKARTGVLANSPLPPGRHLLISAPTFEGRFQDRGWFGCQEELLGMAAEGSALLRRDNELPGEARSVSNIVVLVILGQAQHVLGQQLGLGHER